MPDAAPRTVCPKVCKACPFRRTSWKGWLGADTPTGFIDKTEAGVAMPCHATVDYEGPGWKERAAAAPLCRGALVHLANSGKRPFVPPAEIPVPEFLRREIPQVLEALDGIERDTDTVFTWRHEFIQHHEGGPR